MLVEDASGFRGEADRIVAPANEAEVAAFLREASSSLTPVTVTGARTGVTGGGVSLSGPLLSLEKLNQIEISQGYASVGPGALLADLHAAANRSGQFYPPDPTETSAAVGGTIATNASGSRSFRYGDTRRHVLRLRVILMDGSVLDVRRGDRVDFPVPALPLPQTTKNTGGYRLQPDMDWIDLFVGSEGTLGIVTAAELRLLPNPKEFLAGVVFFPDDDAAISAVESWRVQAQCRMLEYFDRPSLDLLRSRFPETPAAGAAILFEEENADIEQWHDRLVAAKAMVEESWFATTPADRERFRAFRHALPELVNTTMRQHGMMKLGSDYAVPINRNRDMLAEYRRGLEQQFPGRYVIFGHIGDAHLHVNILPASQAEFAQGQSLMLEFAKHAVSLGGTVSAEHGLGKRKAHLLNLQYSTAQIEAMKQVKRRFDPHWLLGRGTLFPYEARG